MNLTKSKRCRIFLYALALLLAFLFFALNYFTPLIADDYSYSMLGKGRGHTNSILDIIKYLHGYYYRRGGRCVAHFFAGFWLYVGKSFFNIANTLVCCMLILLMQFHAIGSLKKKSIFFCWIAIVLWFFTPSWGQVFLWLDGSCNYLWTMTVALLFLVPFRKKMINDSYKLNVPLSVLLFFLGVLAGWTNENLSVAVVFVLVAYFFLKIVRKERITLFEILGSLGFLIGAILLLKAPGNMARLNSSGCAEHLFSSNGLDVVVLKHRLYGVWRVFVHQNMLLLSLISLLLGGYIFFRQKKRLNLFALLYFLAGLISAFSMVGAPYIPDRSCFPPIVFFCITIFSLLAQIEVNINISKINKERIVVSVTLLALVVFSYSFVHSWKGISEVYLKFKNRSEYILDQKSKNIEVILVENIAAKESHCGLYGLEDVAGNADHWTNRGLSNYYGVCSIVGVKKSK